MTRIFDALKKSHAARGPAPIPSEPMVLQAIRPVGNPAVARSPQDRIEIVSIGPVAPMDPEVLREMSSLRVSLEGALPARNPRSVMLLSAQPGDGTSTVALQFAQSLAREADLRVLVVDANINRSSPLFDAARSAVRDTRGRGALDLLPLGERLRQSGQMAVAAIRDLMQSSGAGYDWMIVDGPPLLESPEAAPLAACVDGVVLVVRAGSSKRPVLHRALDLLRRSSANVLGTILNRRRLEIPDFIYRRI